MRNGLMRAAALPATALWSPGAAFDAAVIHRLVAPASLVLVVVALGALALPRLLALLDAALLPTGQAVLDAHLAVLRIGLRRLVFFERLVVPLPYVAAGTMLWLVAAPALAGRGVGNGAVVSVLILGAAPLLVQRCGELAVVFAIAGPGLGAGDVASLPARFNVGVAAAMAAAHVPAPGWLGVMAEAANGIGLWVAALWGWGLARLDRDARRSARAGPVVWWCLAAVAAYAAGWAVYGALYPYVVLLVMGSP